MRLVLVSAVLALFAVASPSLAAEQLGLKEKAAEFYNRVGDYAEVERVRKG
jgi:hypothetical protein